MPRGGEEAKRLMSSKGEKGVIVNIHSFYRDDGFMSDKTPNFTL